MSDDLRSTDRALLTALSHRQGDSMPLSPDQERLLDNWVAGRLSSTDADQAAQLAKKNVFAAERVLEQRLISAANEGTGVPSTLAARVLRASRPPRTGVGGIFNLRWPTLSGWQWSGLGAAVAATAVVAVFGFQFLQAQLRPDQSFQIAMVTIEDRSVLAEGARRTRGLQSQAPSPTPSTGAESAKSRFRDISIPTALLQRAISSASNNKVVAEHSELMNFLRAQNDAYNDRRILIDSALADSFPKEIDKRSSIKVRVYDLDDPRAANIRSKIKPLQADTKTLLLTTTQ
jgi:hypothetical protein